MIETETKDTTNQDTAPGKRPLPDGWRWVRLGDVLQLRNEVVHPKDNPRGSARFVGLEHIESGTGRRIGSVDVEMSELTGRKPRFYERDVVYGYLRPYLNKVWLAEFDGLCSVDQYVYHVLPDRADAEFIAWFMRSPAYLTRAPIDTTPGQLPRIRTEEVSSVAIALPPVREQQRIATILTEQMAAVERARAAAEAQLQLSMELVDAYLQQSLSATPLTSLPLSSALTEVSRGVGDTWREYPVMGATRAGLAPAKEGVGKTPGRYKLVDAGTIFYNPMRILLGSIAIIDEGDEPGITSPDYVVLKTRDGVLHPRWFYYWLRSHYGGAFIKTLARGAVRERMLFHRLAEATIDVPPWQAQCEAAEKLKAVARLRKPIVEQLGVIDKLPATLLQQAFSGKL